MRRGFFAVALTVFCAATFTVNAAAASATGASSGSTATADGARTIRIDADFSWNGVRDCGPDAHYAYTIHDGAGVLADASGNLTSALLPRPG